VQQRDLVRLRCAAGSKFQACPHDLQVRARAAALNSAKRKRLISANPCDGVARPKLERPEMKSLDAARGLKLLAAFEENPDLGPAITTAIGCGLRRGELLALRWSDTTSMHVISPFSVR
jgi:integrase